MSTEWNEIEETVMGEVVGDFDPTFLVNMAAEGAKGGLAEKQKADAKAAADKTAADAKAAGKEGDDAKKFAIDLRKKATFAKADAASAKAKADASPGDKGLADKAKIAAAFAASLDSDATAAEAKAAYYGAIASGQTPTPEQTAAMQAAMARANATPSFFSKMIGPLPVYGWGLVGGGVAAAVTALVIFLKRRK